MRILKHILPWSILAICLVVVANAQHFDQPHGDGGGGGGGGGLAGDATGDINMEGNKLCLDLDKDSCIESPIDDDIDFTTGTVLTLRLSSGTASFLGNTTFNGALMNLADGSFWRLGPGLDTVFVHSTLQTPDSSLIGLGSESNCMVVTQFLDAAGTTDFACPDLGNPQWRWHAADETDLTKWGNWLHDGTDFVADAGKGGIRIKPNLLVNGVTTITEQDAQDKLSFDEIGDGQFLRRSGLNIQGVVTPRTIAWLHPNDMNPAPTDPAGIGSRNSHPFASFNDSATAECGRWTVGMPQNLVTGAAISVFVYAMADTATTGNLGWDIRWENFDPLQDLDVDGFAAAKSTSAPSVNATAGVLSSPASASFTNVQADTPLASSKMRIEICIDPTASTITGDGQIRFVEIRQDLP